jgi:hypothetical protein
MQSLKLSGRRFTTSLLCLALLVALGGCIMGGGTHTVRVSSVPSGAKVYLNDNYVGITPLSLEHVRYFEFFWFPGADPEAHSGGFEPRTIRLEKEGYKAVEKTYKLGDLESKPGSEFGWGFTYFLTMTLEKK